MRITKVTTKTGDKGMTRLGTNEVVSKSSLEIHVLGDLDELSSVLGIVKVSCQTEELRSNIENIQNDIFNIGGEVALRNSGNKLLQKDRVDILEKEIENISNKLPPLKEFLLPGENGLSSKIHHARSVCRRAERSLVALTEKNSYRHIWIQYLNRLSDYLFVLARQSGKSEGQSERMWTRE
ncbi:MAG TPA: cob(I)yrinic acid a,c-diamide adenosyltransferase [Candidatus Marinimicrobia bacterium]|jgi:cob(I)alamin adenosyltransferase|nr:cob(I)yrinic acid a,c-diamide adenosyltransferase [Candidatus Neomarinimicrobiota bacterium]|tara:strand:- start:3832 stop:4374 length:543 start_codon:yes stop_codon:yes gene_type:complete